MLTGVASLLAGACAAVKEEEEEEEEPASEGSEKGGVIESIKQVYPSFDS